MDDAEIWSSTMKNLIPDKEARKFVKSLAHQGMREFALEQFYQATGDTYELAHRTGESDFLIQTSGRSANIFYRYSVSYSGFTPPGSDTQINASGRLTLQYAVQPNFRDIEHPLIVGSSQEHSYGIMTVLTRPN
ncbi:hypothetical protein [Burkholderia sp. S-53]|uniref:hypothetical protein n=1 Tax=Burkholderia sp. S-53 TaxID=2906514 RepID=UPI0021CE5381|nr:hypothetical protein [Burkholderia sp. S-53]UXU86138.1 hypothetical protein LXM88_02375 [Burkholderia sp. S-53]